MAFSHRVAALAAVVAIPLAIAATGFALTESPDSPAPPARVETERLALLRPLGRAGERRPLPLRRGRPR